MNRLGTPAPTAPLQLETWGWPVTPFSLPCVSQAARPQQAYIPWDVNLAPMAGLSSQTTPFSTQVCARFFLGTQPSSAHLVLGQLLLGQLYQPVHLGGHTQVLEEALMG